jgi:hypothetical protein
MGEDAEKAKAEAAAEAEVLPACIVHFNTFRHHDRQRYDLTKM